MHETQDKLISLFKALAGHEPGSITRLPGSGSYRTYYRMQSGGISVIGAHNEDQRENEAFISFTRHFRNGGLPVPEVLAEDPANHLYLIADLGDVTLFRMLCEARQEAAATGLGSALSGSENQLPLAVMNIYKKALRWLPQFQVTAGRTLDYTRCYPRAAFDRQSMMWDLNYFKYYFLKLARIPFDEQKLEEDFTALCDLLLQADSGFFLYRDFQSRNIMVMDGEPWFIDYQGGRKGALQYDIASLLMDAKADLPQAVRTELLGVYLDSLKDVVPTSREQFMKYYHGFVLIRILQALGAYGFRGYYENKPHFLRSIPFALQNLRHLRSANLISFDLPSLMRVIDTMIENPALSGFASAGTSGQPATDTGAESKKSGVLTVAIQSFSYKKGIPPDRHGHGGGFVFDCRALPNPGRLETLSDLTGRDRAIIAFLENEPAVSEFLDHVCPLVDRSVETYMGRGFEYLSVFFGCTGGRHRSVYCAERLAEHLAKHYNVSIKLSHNELSNPV